MNIHIRKGLSVPLAGAPQPVIDGDADIGTVAVLGCDVPGLQARLAAAEGDRVRLGDTLFADKRNPEVCFTAPGSGTVTAIHRGHRRALESVVIRLDDSDAPDARVFDVDSAPVPDSARVRATMLASGLWTAFRTRPFSRIPTPDSSPDAIFVTAIDTNPLAPDPVTIIADAPELFTLGLRCIAALCDVPVFVCTAPDADIPIPDVVSCRRAEFSGPHPAGLPGTHIHFLAPVSVDRSVWHVDYQHVIAIGHLFGTGRLPTKKIVAIAGPMVRQPRLLRVRIGANVNELLRNEVRPGRLRIVSGSPLSGHHAAGPRAYLGRYHHQVCALAEGGEREFLAWMRPGWSHYSSSRAYAAHLLSRKSYALTTTQHGSPRAIVPVGSFEKVMPLDILATPLLKALLVEDTERAQELGALELDEEDLALCSFVCNGKYEYGPFLRTTLDLIEAGR